MKPLVGVIMGSQSDWPKIEGCIKTLEELKIPYERLIVSAHRTPGWMDEYASTAIERGIKVIIAAAGGAAHLPGMTAGKTRLPVIGIPIQTSVLNGVDSLYSIVQMPPGIPVGTMAIGTAGATNAALYAAAILALSSRRIASNLDSYRAAQTAAVLADTDPVSAYATAQAAAKTKET